MKRGEIDLSTINFSSYENINIIHWIKKDKSISWMAKVLKRYEWEVKAHIYVTPRLRMLSRTLEDHAEINRRTKEAWSIEDR